MDRIGEDAPVPPVGNCVVDSAMADGIREMAVAGYGVGWLPDCCATAAHKSLVAIDGDKWTMTLLVVADRD